MDFFIDNSDQIFNVALLIATLVIFVYCILFINKINKKGTDIERKALIGASINTLMYVLAIFSFVIIVAILLYTLGSFGIGDKIRISASGLPLRLSGIVALIFYYEFKHKLELLKK